MKTATVTWITYNNYGTELQAYALQKFIRSLGYSNLILSDRNVLKRHKRLLSAEERPGNDGDALVSGKKASRANFHLVSYLLWPVRRCQRARQTRVLRPYTDSQKQFETFKKQCLDIDYDVAPDRLSALDHRYDCFICGSDQIWSPLRINFNGFYFLSFSQGRKIAYAPSFGTETIPEEKRQTIYDYLEDFTALSVREHANQRQLEEITGKPVALVCDPTLLLDSEAWSDFCSSADRPREPYLACYFLEFRDWYFAYARKLAKKLGLRPILFPNRKEHTKRKACWSSAVGPAEFTALIEGAEFVLTDSYHGSIFSVLFSKPFLCFKRFDDDAPNNQNSRVFSLFRLFGLERLIISEKEFEASDIQPIDYQSVQQKVADFRAASGQYLREKLSECEAACTPEASKEIENP